MNVGTILSPTNPCNGSTTAGSILDLKYDFALGGKDNGNVLGITNNIAAYSTRSTTYTYDDLNRLTGASTAGTDCSVISGTSIPKNWGATFTVDPWSNLTTATVTKCSAFPLSVTANNKNQLTGFGYDAAGNMTQNGSATYTYNAESQMVTAAGVAYTYDGLGYRVKKSSSTEYWGAGPMLESDGNGNLQREFIFANSRRIARRDISTGAVHYFIDDHLGSTSDLVSSTGTVENRYEFAPYGGEWDYSTTVSNQNYKFTGKERDSETGLDNFGARYYSSSMGRFMTPDWHDEPAAVPYASFGDPQTLNLYGYVENQPLNKADDDGHGPPGDWSFGPDCNNGGQGPCQNQNKQQEWKAEQEAKQFAASLQRTFRKVVQSEIKAGSNIAQAYKKAYAAVTLLLTENPNFSLGHVTGKDANNIAKNLTLLFAAPEGEFGELGEARSASNLLRLEKSLAVEAQLGEAGAAFAGKGTTKAIDDINRLVNQYGGNPADWSKMSSSAYKARDGSIISTHWYQNDAMQTGKIEPKVKVDRGGI